MRSDLEKSAVNGDTGSIVSPEALENKSIIVENIINDFKSDKNGNQMIYYTITPQNMYVEIMESTQFLFEDHFLKNLSDPITAVAAKIQFMEKILNQVHDLNLDLVRKLSWILSKLYYSKSLAT